MKHSRKTTPPPILLRYIDYRDFLSDYYTWHKSVDGSFTYRSFAAKAGVSASLLRDILSGRQNLTPAVMNKYAEAMELTGRDCTYFEAMVQFTNSSNNIEKNRWFDKMAQLRGRSTFTFLDTEQYEYFSQWFIPVVRELVDGLPSDIDPKRIAEVIDPRPSVPNIKRALRLMVKLKLLRIDSEGKWRKSDNVISSEMQIQSLALRKFHLQMIERAREALDRYTSEQREFQTLTISGSPQLYTRMKKRIQEFTDELLAMAEDEQRSAETVFQVNLHLFPFVTRKPENLSEMEYE